MGSHKTRLLVLGAVVALAAAICGAAVAMGSSSDPAPVADSTGGVATDAAPTNAAGQAYGALPDGPDDPGPDLVRVVATNGKTGYCRDKDTLGPCPDDAEANTKACLRGYTIPVYESDGTTQIGEFVVGGPGSEAVYGKADGSKTTMTAREDGSIVTTKTAADGSVISQTLEALDGTVTTVE
jgi:hypothetical protein